MPITEVTFRNVDDREGREGTIEECTITGKQLNFIVKSAMGFKELYAYLMSITEWKVVEE